MFIRNAPAYRIPTNRIPTNRVPTYGVPTNGVPTYGVPAGWIPTARRVDHGSVADPIVIEHVGQDVFGVLESLGHLCVVGLECMVQRQRLSLALLIHVSHQSALRVKQNLCMVLEVYLHYLVAQSEHYRVFSPHPLLHVDGLPSQSPCATLRTTHSVLCAFLLLVILQVRPEMLKQCHLLL